jgi:hypothetical protein
MKRRALTSLRASAERFGGARAWLLTLLLAAPFCASANVVAENPFAAGGVQNIRNPFPAATWAFQLADHDHDRGGERGRSHQSRRSEPSSKRWDNAERRNRIEDRRRRFEALPRDQQQRIMQTRERFLHLPPEDRERLRQRWQQMSPEERRRWRESGSHRD